MMVIPNWQTVPWALIGFVGGAALGFAWAKKAKSNIASAVKTDVSNGVVRVEFDTLQAAKSGFSDDINQFIDGVF
jgi:hypothetical protein